MGILWLVLLQATPPVAPGIIEQGGTTAVLVGAILGLIKLVEYLIKRNREPEGGDPACSKEVSENIQNLTDVLKEFLHKQEIRDLKAPTSANSAILDSQEQLIKKLGDLVGELRKDRDV